MTINSTTRKTNNLAGNGNTATYPFAFKVFTDADVVVKKLEVSTSIETTLTLGVNNDYIVTLNEDQNGNPGGSITLKSGGNDQNLASGFQLVITSALEPLQGTDLTNQGGFYPEVINDALDKAIILHQQQQIDLDRAIKFSLTNTINSVEITENAAARANKVLAFDNTGEIDLQNAAPVAFLVSSSAPSNPPVGSIWYDSISGRTFIYYQDVDSTQWVEASPPFDTLNETFLQTGTGAVTRQVNAKLRETVSVKDFGAKGNGTDDDTAAIVLAINSTANNVIYFPSGTYLITSTITPANAVSFKGEKNSFIKWAGANGGTMFNVSDPAKTIDSIDTLNIHGWKGSGSDYAKIGLEYGHNNTGTFGNIFRDVTFAFFQGSGSGYALRGHPNTDAGGTTYTNGANDFKFYECSFSNSDNACSFGLPDHEFHGCNIKISCTNGIAILSNARVRFFGGYNSPTTHAFKLANNCVGLNCYGVWLEGGDILGYTTGGAINVYDNISFYDCHLATVNTNHIFDFSQITGGTITVKGGALGVLANWPTVGKGVIKLQHAIPISVEDVAEPSAGHGTPRVISFVNTSGSTGHNLLTIKRNGLTSFGQLAVPTLSRENASTYGDIKFANDKGIDFSNADDTATGETTTNSKLTDYEEGTFTPTVLGSSSNPTVTYHANTYACYVKIGSVVQCDFKIIMSAYSGGSGNILIGGLPYVSKSATHYQSHGHISYERINHDSGERIFLRLNANTNSVNVSAVNDNVDMSDVPVSELVTGGSNRIIKGSIIYITDA